MRDLRWSAEATLDGPGRFLLRLEAVTPETPNVPLGDAGPDDIVLSLGTQELAHIDGHYLSTEVASGFTGRMLGLAAIAAPVHVRSVSYRPLQH